MVLHPKYLRTWRRHEMIRGQWSKGLQILYGGVQTLLRNLTLSLCFLKKILWVIKNHLKVMRKMVCLLRLHHKFFGAPGCFLNKYQMVFTSSYRWEFVYSIFFPYLFCYKFFLLSSLIFAETSSFFTDQQIMWLWRNSSFMRLFLLFILVFDNYPF